jgi:seryl-tRNA synthetase
MLDIKFIRENPEKVKKGCQDKGVMVDIDRLLELDEKRRGMIQGIESLRAKQKLRSSEVAKLRNKKEKEGEIKKLGKIKKEIDNLEREFEKVKKEYNQLMLQVPNMPLEDVKVGQGEKDNEILRHEGEIPKFDFQPRNYLEIAEKLDLIDTKKAAKVSGSRFGYLKREAALLEFALIQFAMETLTKEGFIPVVPPVMIKKKAMQAMGYLERGEEEIYYLPKDKLYLVGTSEQSIGPMHMDEIFKEDDLPRRYVGFSSCFRREAGSYGKDTKGILRVHQFDKVEMFSFCKPEDSKIEHEFFLSLEEQFLQKLNLPYRVVKMCTGDLGDPAASKFDLEVWLPGQSEFREVTSTSNCTDFQARRLKIRYKPSTSNLQPPTPKFVHTLNGTAFAIGRMIIAIVENYQLADGSVRIPGVLQKYMGGIRVIRR